MVPRRHVDNLAALSVVESNGSKTGEAGEAEEFIRGLVVVTRGVGKGELANASPRERRLIDRCPVCASTQLWETIAYRLSRIRSTVKSCRMLVRQRWSFEPS